MVKKITESVYVIEHEEAANNVIIIGKKGVVLVDTSLFPEKAKSIAKFIRDLTMKPVELVFNTHYHPDTIAIPDYAQTRFRNSNKQDSVSRLRQTHRSISRYILVR